MTLTDYFEGKRTLGKYGIHSINSWYVGSASEAVSRAAGRPIAMKAISPKALHKSKSGLVKLDLKTRDEIKAAYEELSKKARALKPYRIIAQEMSSGGIEVIIGGKTDPQFGKVILLGLGGIYVEAFKDFSIRACPITMHEANGMIESLKSSSIITYHSKNKGMLAKLLVKVSKMLVSAAIAELDLNPVILREKSYDIVDIRMMK